MGPCRGAGQFFNAELLGPRAHRAGQCLFSCREPRFHPGNHAQVKFVAATPAGGIGFRTAAQFFGRNFAPEYEIGKTDRALFDGAAIQRQFRVEKISGKCACFPNRPRKIEVKRIAVADCDFLFFFDLQCGLPLSAIEFDPEVGDLERVSVEIGRVEIFWGGFDQELRAVSATPGGFSDGTRTFHHDDHR
jgi:hypothetical protein